jgi:hypothetical protein
MLPIAQVAVIMYSIHADLCPRPRKRSVRTVYGALKGFILTCFVLPAARTSKSKGSASVAESLKETTSGWQEKEDLGFLTCL